MDHEFDDEESWTMAPYMFLLIAVSQKYSVEVHNEAIILGNEALVACQIPSFISDLVEVVGWVDGHGNQFQAGGPYGTQ